MTALGLAMIPFTIIPSLRMRLTKILYQLSDNTNLQIYRIRFLIRGYDTNKSSVLYHGVRIKMQPKEIGFHIFRIIYYSAVVRLD